MSIQVHRTTLSKIDQWVKDLETECRNIVDTMMDEWRNYKTQSMIEHTLSKTPCGMQAIMTGYPLTLPPLRPMIKPLPMSTVPGSLLADHLTDPNGKEPDLPFLLDTMCRNCSTRERQATDKTCTNVIVKNLSGVLVAHQ